jgi:hypothetical protein
MVINCNKLYLNFAQMFSCELNLTLHAGTSQGTDYTDDHPNESRIILSDGIFLQINNFPLPNRSHI